jgi:hypothetical protein
MPLANRVVVPVCLGGFQLEKGGEGDEGSPVHLAVANNELIGVVLQLACLVRHADDIFCDIAEECQKVYERSDNITKRITHIEEIVSKLDAKTVQIRKFSLSVSTLSTE